MTTTTTTTTTTTRVDEAAAVVTENETQTHDLTERFRRARDQLSEMSAESDSPVISSARFVAVKSTAEKLVEGLAISLEEARADLVQAREAHREALEGHYEAILPEILDQRHRLAVEADEHISALNETLTEIMELNGEEVTARNSAGRGGADTLRADKIIAGWVAAHLPGLRTMRSSGIFVYGLCRSDLSAIYAPHAEESK